MYALPWSLSDECDYTGLRSRDHRREHLRGLRAMRISLSDRRGVLRAATGRRADAQAARDAYCLSRSRRRTGDRTGA
jgi:hypothetical protein